MNLLLDIGNSRIKWALSTENGLTQQQAISHSDLSAPQLCTQVFAPCGQVKRVLVANVAGAAMAELVRQAARDCWQLEAEFAVTAAQHGVVRNAYAQPSKLGVDRWLALLGAYAMTSTATLVVDVGTAMTIDALDSSGLHLGGLIVPGPQLMMSSLMRNTSDIAVHAQAGMPVEAFFADNTMGCVYQGAVQASAALIETAYARMNQAARLLLLTGGASDMLQPLLKMSVQWVPDLVLRGLAVAMDRSSPAQALPTF